MKLREIAAPSCRLYIKSEFGPTGDHWPALSFTHRKIASDFALQFRRDQDFVVYVGTGDPEKTEDPAHRRRLLSVISVEPRAPISTRDIVSPESWKRAIEKWGVRWQWSLPITKAHNVIGFPEARKLIPKHYSGLGTLQNLGRAIEVTDSERNALLGLDVEPIELHLTDRVRRVLALNTDDDLLRRELSRLALTIQSRVTGSGSVRIGTNSIRTAPNVSDLFQALMDKWDAAGGRCALCDGAIPLERTNKLLQVSCDRIDSTNIAYDWENAQLTHLGCNLAKSDATMEEWSDFLAMIRQC